jgi:hypothetical protein
MATVKKVKCARWVDVGFGLKWVGPAWAGGSVVRASPGLARLWSGVKCLKARQLMFFGEINFCGFAFGKWHGEAAESGRGAAASILRTVMADPFFTKSSIAGFGRGGFLNEPFRHFVGAFQWFMGDVSRPLLRAAGIFGI